MDVSLKIGKNELSFARRKKGEPPVDARIEAAPYHDIDALLSKEYSNPSTIPLSTLREMQYHPIISSGLFVLTHTIQQTDWWIESDNAAVSEEMTIMVRKIWNRLIRSISKSFVYGFSPNVKIFTMNNDSNFIEYKKIKDLKPEYCKVILDNNGNFGGFRYKNNTIDQIIKPEEAFWYTDNMEDGNFYGESRLRRVHQDWYFSKKMHMFTNRYYERFGDPLIVGRVPSMRKVSDNSGKQRNATEVLNDQLRDLKNSSIAVLPGDRDEKTGNYLYDVSYLESSMRGLDFDLYLKRLDMKMMRGLNIPDTLFGGSSGGSLALNKGQWQTFLITVRGALENIKDYIDLYVIPQLMVFNFPGKSARFVYQPTTGITADMISALLIQMVADGKVVIDTTQLSKLTGLQLDEVTQAVDNAKKVDPKKTDPNTKKQNDRTNNEADIGKSLNKAEAQDIVDSMFTRIKGQITKSNFSESKDDLAKIKLGFKGRYVDTFHNAILENFSPKDRKQEESVRNMSQLYCDNLFSSLEKNMYDVMVTSYPDQKKMESEVYSLIHSTLVPDTTVD